MVSKLGSSVLARTILTKLDCNSLSGLLMSLISTSVGAPQEIICCFGVNGATTGAVTGNRMA